MSADNGTEISHFRRRTAHHKIIKFTVFQALEVARQFTGQNNNNTAKEEFVKMTNHSDMFFNDQPIPAHESGSTAFRLCSSVEGARQNCPHRWRAIQRWFTETREVTVTEFFPLCLLTFRPSFLCRSL